MFLYRILTVLTSSPFTICCFVVGLNFSMFALPEITPPSRSSCVICHIKIPEKRLRARLLCSPPETVSSSMCMLQKEINERAGSMVMTDRNCRKQQAPVIDVSLRQPKSDKRLFEYQVADVFQQLYSSELNSVCFGWIMSIYIEGRRKQF